MGTKFPLVIEVSLVDVGNKLLYKQFLINNLDSLWLVVTVICVARAKLYALTTKIPVTTSHRLST